MTGSFKSLTLRRQASVLLVDIQIKNMQVNHLGRLIFITVTCLLLFFSNKKAMSQQNQQMVRLAKVQVDPPQLEQYNAALKVQMATAIRVEPGVLTYYAVADKQDPSRITILEIYADSAAYISHIQTSHFKKYKETVQNMVKSLELMDVNLIGFAKKPGM
jgi:quinol monooxygenase YgiN